MANLQARLGDHPAYWPAHVPMQPVLRFNTIALGPHRPGALTRRCDPMIDDTRYEGRDLEVLANIPNYHSWIMSWFSPYVHGRVLEYGAGSGTISQYLHPLAQSLTLIEPSANLHTSLHAKFADDPSVQIGMMTMEEHVCRLESATVDTAVLVNVLEHIEDDRMALSELSRVVTPGGYVLIFVPALSFLMSRLDVQLGHFRRYHRAELQEKLKATGIEVVTCSYFDFPGIVPWFVLNKLLGSTSFSPVLVRLYDRAIVPLARAVESKVAPPFGKNLVAIGRCHGTGTNAVVLGRTSNVDTTASL
jgi:SAM-dependent methyltransferase